MERIQVLTESKSTERVWNTQIILGFGVDKVIKEEKRRGAGGEKKPLCFCPIPWGCGSRAGGRAERVRQEPSAEPHPSPQGSAAGAGHGLVLPSSSLPSSWQELGRVCLHKLGTSSAFFFFFKLLLLASGRREAFNTGGLEPGSGQSAGWGLEGPTGYWAIRLATAWKGPTPAFLQLGHLPRMGAKCSAPLPRKQTRALFKTPELKRVFFFYFLLSSTNSPRSQLMISFLLLQKFKLLEIVTSAGFRSRFHFARLWQSPISAGWSRRWEFSQPISPQMLQVPSFLL